MQTEINNSAIRTPNSELPQGWRWVKLGEVLKEPLKNGLNYRKENFGVGTKFVNVSDIFCSETINNAKLDRIDVSSRDVEKYHLRTGDILIVRSSLKREGVAYPALFLEDGEPVVFCGFSIRIRPDKEKIAPLYLLHHFRSAIAREKLVGDSDTVTITNVDQGTLLSIDIPLPPLPEQKRIVSKLQELMKEVERARTACEKQLEAAKALSAAYLREVFESEESKNWERKKLGEVCEIISKGTTPTTYGHSFVSSGIPFLRAEDITGGPVDFSSVTFHITKETHDFLNRSKLHAGDLLITIAGTLGRVGYIPEGAPEANCNQAVAFARLNPTKADSKFLCFLLQVPKVILPFIELRAGGTIKNLNLEQVRSMEINLPQLLVQHRIATEIKGRMAQIKNLQSAINNSNWKPHPRQF